MCMCAKNWHLNRHYMHSSGVLSTSALLCTHYCHLLQSFPILWDGTVFQLNTSSSFSFPHCLASCFLSVLPVSINLITGLPEDWGKQRFHEISSVAQSCLTLCDPMNHSTPGLPVHHQLPELPQTHVHGVGDAIQPFHPLLSSSPPAFSLSQHQGLFQWASSSHQVAKVLELQLQSFQWIFRTDFL